MSIGNHLSRVAKRRIRITTVDPSQRLIQGVDKTGQGQQVYVNDIPPFFTWPQVNEEWSIYEENGYWRLGYKFFNQEESAALEALAPGESYPPVSGGGGTDTDPAATTTSLGMVELTTAPTDPANPKVVTDEDPRNTNARTPTAHIHPQSDVTGLAASLAAKENTANKGVANGYAPLDSGLLVPVANLPVATGASKGIVQIGTGATNAMAGNTTMDQIPPAADTNFNGHKGTNAGDPTAAQDLATKHYVDTLGTLAQMPAVGVRLKQTANKSIANPNARVQFDAEDFDTDGFHDNVTNNTRITIPAGKNGTYLFTASVGVPTAASGTRNFSLIKNGTQTVDAASVQSNTVDETRQTLSAVVQMAAGDYMEVDVYHNSGAAITSDLNYTFFAAAQIPGNNAVLMGPQAPAVAAKVTHSANQVFSSGGATNVFAFDTVVRDDAGSWASGTNSRLTAQTAGWYQIHASAFLGNGTTPGYRQLCLRKNGSTYLQTTLQLNSTVAQDTEQEVSTVEYMNPGDYVEVILFFSGAATTVSAMAGGRSPQFAIARIPGAQGSALAATTTLPSNPVDGQECYYLADATNGVVWHLKYVSSLSGTSKWTCIGGSPLFSKQTSNGSTTATTATAYTNRPPDITVPLAGDYIVMYGSRMYVQNPAGSNLVLQVFAGSTMLEQIDHWQGTAGGTTTLWGGHEAQEIKATALAASTIIQLRAYVGAAGLTGNLERGFLKVMPVRVG